MSTPMSRYEMRGLKSKNDEKLRSEKVNKCVNEIYRQSVQMAGSSTNTSYSLNINPNNHRIVLNNINTNSEYNFYKDNMEEILSGLQRLFPDCSVRLSNMCTGNDGKRYDISKMDEKMLPFINHKNAFECIVVDWS